MTGLLEDLRYAIRSLRGSLPFALTAVAMLALGIGVNAGVFTLARAVLFNGFPSVDDNDRVAYIASDRSACCLSYPDFDDWRRAATSFDGLAVVRGSTVSVGDGDGLPESHEATEISADTFRLAGRRPLLGRDFSAADGRPGAAPVAILSNAYWQNRFAGDPGIVGRTLRIDGVPTTVVGVMPAGFVFPQKQDLWLPLVPTAELLRRDARDLWFAFGRLADGVTLEQARAEMAAIGQRLANEYPDTNRTYLPAVRTFGEFFIGPAERLVYASMWAAVAFVLLIVCTNLANLLLARATSQSREIAVRVALGAGPWRIVRQLMLENLLISGAGALLGWWIAKWTVYLGAAAERGPGLSPWRVLDYTMDYRVLAYVAATAIGTAVLFGLAPARQLLTFDVNAALKDGGRGFSGGAAAKRLVTLLLTSGVALAVVLLASAGLLLSGWLEISSRDTGVVTAGVVTGFIEPPAARYSTADARARFYDELERRVEALPGVESVAFASVLPTWGARLVPYETPDQPALNGEPRSTTGAIVVSPGYFDALGATLRAGRDFEDADGPASLPVALVNELFAARHWPGQSALGKRVRLGDGPQPDEWLTVVGVVSNIVQADATRQSLDPLVYLPHRQAPRSALWLLVHAREAPLALEGALRREVAALDADLPLRLGPYTLEERMAETYWSSELYASLFAVFAAIALFLAAFGLYSTVAYAVTRDVQDIGIRMAMGAKRRDVVLFVLGRGMRPAIVGLALGLAASVGATRLLGSLLPSGLGMGWVVYVGAATLLLLAALLGCLLPARSASRVSLVAVLTK